MPPLCLICRVCRVPGEVLSTGRTHSSTDAGGPRVTENPAEEVLTPLAMHRTCCPGDDYPFSATRINDSNNEAVQRLERLKVSGVCRRSGVLQCCV